MWAATTPHVKPLLVADLLEKFDNRYTETD